MNLYDLYAKLEAAKKLLTETVPAGLDETAAVLRQVADAAATVAATLRQHAGDHPLQLAAGGNGVTLDHVRDLKAEFELIGERRPTVAADAAAAHDALGPVARAVLAKLLAAAVQALLDALQHKSPA